MKKIIKPLSEITKEDYSNLFSGKLKCIVTSINKEGYGKKNSWLKVIIWNITHREIISCGYTHYSRHYTLVVATTTENVNCWNSKDLSDFVAEHNLCTNDTLTINYVSPGGKGGHRYLDGAVYKITDDDLEIIDRLRGN